MERLRERDRGVLLEDAAAVDLRRMLAKRDPDFNKPDAAHNADAAPRAPSAAARTQIAVRRLTR